MIDKLRKIVHNNIAVSELVSCGIWSITGTLISKLLLFVIWIIVARLLLAEQYGEFSIIRSTTMMFADFVGFSFGIAATKYIAQYATTDKKRVEKLIGVFLLYSLIIGSFVFVGVFFASEWICVKLLKAEYLIDLLRFSSIIMLVSTLNNSQLGILRGFNLYKTITKINLIQILFSFPVYVCGTYFWGISGAVFAYVIYNVIICLLAQYEIFTYCKKSGVRPSYRNLHKELKLIFNYVFPYFVAMFLTIVAQWYNESMVASLGSSGFVQLGYYSAVNVIQTMVIGITVMVCVPFVSIMAKYDRQEGGAFVEKLNFLVPLYLSLIVAIPIMMFPEILSLFYGHSFANKGMYTITVIMISYTILIVYKQSLARLVAVHEMQWIYLLDSLLLSVLFIVGFKYLCFLGIKGLALTYFISYIISSCVFTPIYLRRKLMTKDVLKDKILLILLVCGFLALGSYFVLENIYIRLVLMFVLVLLMLCQIKNKLKICR